MKGKESIIARVHQCSNGIEIPRARMTRGEYLPVSVAGIHGVTPPIFPVYANIFSTVPTKFVAPRAAIVFRSHLLTNHKPRVVRKSKPCGTLSHEVKI